MNGSFGGRSIGTGLMVAWTMAGMILASRIPLLGAIILSIAGLPALLVVLAWGVPWFLTYGGMTMVLAFFWGGWSSSMILIPLMLAPAAVLSWGIKNGLAAFQALAIAIVFACLFSTTLWVVSPLVSSQGAKIWEAGERFRGQGELAKKQILAMNTKDVDPESIDLFLEHFQSWVEFVALLIPMTFLFVWHMVSLGIFYLGAVAFAGWMGFAIQPLPKFSTWRFNWNIIWIMLAGWFLFYGAEYFGAIGLEKPVRMLGANFLAISKILFFIMGFSLLFHYYELNKLSNPVKLGLSVIACFFNQVLVWLGIADIWFDFRTPKPPVTKANDSDDQDSLF